jgi:hypothetical protein
MAHAASTVRVQIEARTARELADQVSRALGWGMYPKGGRILMATVHCDVPRISCLHVEE